MLYGKAVFGKREKEKRWIAEENEKGEDLSLTVFERIKVGVP